MRRGVVALVSCSLVASVAAPAWARPPWKERIDRIVAGRSVGVAVRNDTGFIYMHDPKDKRVPASNQKLLLTLALFDTLGPQHRATTRAVARDAVGPTVDGDLWVLGRGDPTVTDGSAYARSLPFRPSRLKKLARLIDEAGIGRVEGSVMGSTTYFARDWWAPGWKPSFPADEVPLATALTYEGNEIGGSHITDPEQRVATALTKRLEARGVKVKGAPGSGVAPDGVEPIAEIASAPLEKLATRMNRQSVNFFAEELGKLLGAEVVGRPGTIAKGASSVERWAKDRGVVIRSYDSAGLSYDNRASPKGIVGLLARATVEGWGPVVRQTLPSGGQGTLEDRLAHVRVRAKTGTLSEISTLSGWVWLSRVDEWAEFSIMSRGMDKSVASDVEDEIVRILNDSAG